MRRPVILKLLHLKYQVKNNCCIVGGSLIYFTVIFLILLLCSLHTATQVFIAIGLYSLLFLGGQLSKLLLSLFKLQQKLIKSLEVIYKAYTIAFYHNSSLIESFQVIIQVLKLLPIAGKKQVIFAKGFYARAQYIVLAELLNTIFTVKEARDGRE